MAQYAMHYGFRGLGQDSGFDITTALGTSGLWMLVGGAALLYWMIAGEPARERRTRLRTAKEKYEAETRRIKGEYTRTRRRKPPGAGYVPLHLRPRRAKP